MPDSIILFYVPFPHAQAAHEVATKAIVQKIAACANILAPTTSLYLWAEEGKEESLQQETETPVLFKVSPAHKKSFISFIEEHHPYTCPAIISLPAEANDAFKTWVHRHDKVKR